MQQGNLGFALAPSTSYSPGASGGAGPSVGQEPITSVLVTQGTSATLDYYDAGGNRITITLGAVTTPTVFPITLIATGSSLTSSRFFGFSRGSI